jgi:hypothetical protein
METKIPGRRDALWLWASSERNPGRKSKEPKSGPSILINMFYLLLSQFIFTYRQHVHIGVIDDKWKETELILLKIEMHILLFKKKIRSISWTTKKRNYIAQRCTTCPSKPDFSFQKSLHAMGHVACIARDPSRLVHENFLFTNTSESEQEKGEGGGGDGGGGWGWGWG